MFDIQKHKRKRICILYKGDEELTPSLRTKVSKALSCFSGRWNSQAGGWLVSNEFERDVLDTLEKFERIHSQGGSSKKRHAATNKEEKKRVRTPDSSEPEEERRPAKSSKKTRVQESDRSSEEEDSPYERSYSGRSKLKETKVPDWEKEKQREKKFFSSFENGFHRKKGGSSRSRSRDDSEEESPQHSQPIYNSRVPKTKRPAKHRTPLSEEERPRKKRRIQESSEEEERSPLPQPAARPKKPIKKSVGYLDRIRQINKRFSLE